MRKLRRKIPIEIRFWKKVNKTTENECWDWVGSLTMHGYGHIGMGRRGEGMLSAPRVSWEIHHGNIPKGMHILHHCDNRKCVNPRHLFLGTNYDNILDRISKDRSMKGESHTNHKLTHENVLEIRRSYIPRDKNFSGKSLAKKFCVSPKTIQLIIKGVNWAWVKSE